MKGKLSAGDIIDRLAGQAGITKKLAGEIIRAIPEVIESGLISDGDVKVRGLGTFRLKRVASKKGRNPQTGEEVIIPPHNKLIFLPEESFREQANEEFRFLGIKVLEEVGSSQLAVGSSQSAVGSSQSAVGSSQSAVGSSQSAVGGSQSAVGSSQSAVGSSQSAVGSSQSAVGSSQSAVGGSQSAVGGSQSAVGSSQSAVGSSQPAVGSSQSAVGSSQSAVGSSQPAVGSSQSAVGSSQSAVGSSEQEIRNEKPETKIPEQETRNEKPETKIPEQETRNQKPEIKIPESETLNSTLNTQHSTINTGAKRHKTWLIPTLFGIVAILSVVFYFRNCSSIPSSQLAVPSSQPVERAENKGSAVPSSQLAVPSSQPVERAENEGSAVPSSQLAVPSSQPVERAENEGSAVSSSQLAVPSSQPVERAENEGSIDGSAELETRNKKPETRNPEPKTHLYQLAREVYGNPFLWVLIYRANLDKISNPDHEVIPSELTIPTLAGTPKKLTSNDSLNISDGYRLVYEYYLQHRDARAEDFRLVMLKYKP